ncbi:MAG: DUF1579 family protein [Acidobacteriota bacterium]
MSRHLRRSLQLLLSAGALALALAAHASEPASPDSSQAMAAMMAKMKKVTTPGPHHRFLERFVGTWNTETRITMGPKPGPAEKGIAETSWLMPGRWIQTKGTGRMMGRPLNTMTIMGYDNFKQSYVVTTVTDMDTAMNRSEGDIDPGGEVLLVYGTLDEYITGEHDKMVKTVYRFLSEDEFVMEIHDLPIGEKNTKVVEVRHVRRK